MVLGVITARDAWVYDFDTSHLGNKVSIFINSYEKTRIQLGGNTFDDSELGTEIKWTRDLKRQLRSGVRNFFDKNNIRQTLYRPFTNKFLYYHQSLNEMQYQMPQVFPTGEASENKVICFLAPGGRTTFSVLAAGKLPSYSLFIDSTQCLPLYRYTKDGECISNITEWSLKRVNEHYRKEFGRHFEEMAGGESITAEDIFAYTYAVLHDPVYRYDYKNDLLREFPRLPLYHDFADWREMGRELLDLHINFESAEPYPLERIEKPGFDGSGRTLKPILRADKKKGLLRIDEQTTLTGVPEFAWEYELGNRTALEWVLDQYKEKKPRDPTIRERFNTYRFADYKEEVIELLRRVCAVSYRTAEIVGGMAYWMDGKLVVSGDRDKHEWAMMGLANWFSDPEDEEWLAELAAMPDIREQEE